MREFIRFWTPFVIAVLVSYTIMTQVIINAYIPTGSMESTISPGDQIIGIRLIHNYKRGDIVIFKDPDGSGEYLIKRIIGMPGEKVQIRYDGRDQSAVFINGKKLPEPYIKEPMKEDFNFEITVPEHGYFVMGDNRNDSYDARYWEHKIIYDSDIAGIAKLRYAPFSKFGIVG